MTPTPPHPRITPFLWFDDDAEQAVAFYRTLFDDFELLEELRWGEGGPVPAGTLMTARFRLAGQELILLNGGPVYHHTEAFSLFVPCDDQAEIDRLWTKLCDGGTPSRCGWLKDRFGVSWQIVPSNLGRMLTDPDPVRARRVSEAMLAMVKLDLAGLERAYRGS